MTFKSKFKKMFPRHKKDYHLLSNNEILPSIGVTKIKRGLLYKIALAVILIGTTVYLIDFSTISSSLPAQFNYYAKLLRDKKTYYIDDDQSKEEINDHFLVNTPGCKMSSMPVMSSKIQQFFVPQKQIVCSPPALTASDESNLWINLDQDEMQKFYNINDPNLLQCYYHPFERKSEKTVMFQETIIKFVYGEKLKIYSEFIKVHCDYDTDEEMYIDYHSFLPKKPVVEERVRKIKLTRTAKTIRNSVEKLSILVLGIDSLSRLNFHRLMNMTNAFVNKMDGVEFLGYNKVGDNTYPNLIPLLTGLNTEELKSACVPSDNITYDNCNFIWNQFMNAGYKTLFAEDCAYLGLFNYFRPGFEYQPTDYYMRTVINEMEKNIAFNHVGNYKLCLGDKRPIDVLFKYIEKFTSSMKNDPFFSFFWTSSMTHDYINYPTLIDENVSDLLNKMQDQGFLNHTVLLLLSDHGIRWGSFRDTNQGMLEERQPLLYFILPKWFKKVFPSAYKNLLINRRRLTSPFDLYETLKDLSDIDKISTSSIQKRSMEMHEQSLLDRSISLFLQVPPTRSCDSAGIQSHWCTCYEKYELPTTDHRVQKVAKYVVKYINELLSNHRRCNKLFLNSILFANLGIVNSRIFELLTASKLMTLNNNNVMRTPKSISSKVLSRNQNIYDITVRVQTKPGLGEFESTVRFSESGNEEFKMVGTISRTNLYGQQSYCIDDYKLKLYCFCNP